MYLLPNSKRNGAYSKTFLISWHLITKRRRLINWKHLAPEFDRCFSLTFLRQTRACATQGQNSTLSLTPRVFHGLRPRWSFWPGRNPRPRGQHSWCRRATTHPPWSLLWGRYWSDVAPESHTKRVYRWFIFDIKVCSSTKFWADPSHRSSPLLPQILVSLLMSAVKAFMVKATVAPDWYRILTTWWSTTSLSHLYTQRP